MEFDGGADQDTKSVLERFGFGGDVSDGFEEVYEVGDRTSADGGGFGAIVLRLGRPITNRPQLDNLPYV